MSLVDGSLDADGENVDFVAQGIRIHLGKRAALGLKEGRWTDVSLGIRAEDVRVVDANAATAAGSFDATVLLLEPIGSDTFVELAVGPASIVARITPDLPLELGQTVRAELAPGRIHLFERGNGDRINA